MHVALPRTAYAEVCVCCLQKPATYEVRTVRHATQAGVDAVRRRMQQTGYSTNIAVRKRIITCLLPSQHPFAFRTPEGRQQGLQGRLGRVIGRVGFGASKSVDSLRMPSLFVQSLVAGIDVRDLDRSSPLFGDSGRDDHYRSRQNIPWFHSSSLRASRATTGSLTPPRCQDVRAFTVLVTSWRYLVGPACPLLETSAVRSLFFQPCPASGSCRGFFFFAFCLIPTHLPKCNCWAQQLGACHTAVRVSTSS